MRAILMFHYLWGTKSQDSVHKTTTFEDKNCRCSLLYSAILHSLEDSLRSCPMWWWKTHSEHRFPAPSSKLCQIWLRHWRGTLFLRAAVHRRGQRPPIGLGTDCGSNLAPKHARKHEAHPSRVKKKEKKEFHLESNDFGFIWASVSNMVSYKTNVWYKLSCL